MKSKYCLCDQNYFLRWSNYMSSKNKEPGSTYSKYILYYSASTWKSVAKNSLINWKIFWWIRFNHLRLESERIITYKHVCWNFFENFFFFFLPGVFAVYFKSYDLNCCQHKNSPCLPLYRKFTMVNWNPAWQYVFRLLLLVR